MKIATWNVNSIKARLSRVLGWIEREQPDILCLQELKVVAEKFPTDELAALGYTAATHTQQGGYNGVAILSRVEPDRAEPGFPNGAPDPQARLLRTQFGELTVLCIYVPNGSEVGSEKYRYKVGWLERFQTLLEEHYDPSAPLVICGDYNMAIDEKDVNRPQTWGASVLFHPEMRHVMARLTAWGLVDTHRLHHPDGGEFTWWDYRGGSFHRNDGLKIDYILATHAVADRCTTSWVDRAERKGTADDKPSDHAPLVIEVDLALEGAGTG